MRKIFVMAALAATMMGWAATPQWLRDVEISPSGSDILFSYKGDIYKVPVNGGVAKRLTTQPSYESSAVWSPDGSKIAFASDRNGNNDVYIMDADGGTAQRLTFSSMSETPIAFTPDGKYVLFAANIQDQAESAAFPAGYQGELYKVSVDGGRSIQVVDTPVANLSYIPGSSSFIFEDTKGSEDKWRKHHTSSVTRDIWLYDADKGTFDNLTMHAGEDRDPVVNAAGNGVYFLSERDGGSFNVYFSAYNAGKLGAPQAVTSFTKHPVRFLSGGNNGTLAFAYDGDIYTLVPGTEPQKVNIDVDIDDADQVKMISIPSPEEAVVSPDGKQIAFIARGELFVASVDYSSIKQISHTPQAESGVVWGKDGRTLYYASDRDGVTNIYKASISRKDDPNFSNATLVEETLLFPADGVERAEPSLSPDGKKLAYIEDRAILKVRDLSSGTDKLLADADKTTNYRSGGLNAVWSPDSKWIAMEVSSPSHEPYTDIAVINVSNGDYHLLTNTGYFDGNPHWVLNGEAIIFSSERYGMRNHASWGSMNDVMITFLTQESYDKFRLNEEDYNLLKEVEKAQKSSKKDDSDAKSDKKKKKDESAEENKEEKKEIVLDFNNLDERTIRLTPNSSDLADFTFSKDGETLYYLSAFEGKYDLWKADLRKDDVSIAKKLDTSSSKLQLDKDGNIFILGKAVKKYVPSSGKLTSVSMSGMMELDPVKEREYMFDYVHNEAKQRFYVADMNGVDWDGYAEHYRTFLPHINNNYDFADLLSELLGELNVSHSGSRYYPTGTKTPTASLGLLYDMTYDGDGMKVSEIVERGPFDRASSDLKAGDIIEKINGVELTADTDISSLLNGLAKKKTLVSIYDPKNGKRWDEVVLPINASAMRNLLYDRWVKQREEDVKRWSNGKLGYVHLRSMSDDSFRKIYAKIFGEYIDCDGIVIDTRWNGGGRLHEDIEVLFSGNKYLTQEIHGRESSVMPSRRWTKPSIMITGEANYSNAHGTPWVYKHLGLGKLVGMPVPGTMSSVNWIDLQDPSMLFGVPVVGFRTAEGNYLENTQLEPDIKVANNPADLSKGEDTQLRVAVEELLKELK